MTGFGMLIVVSARVRPGGRATPGGVDGARGGVTFGVVSLGGGPALAIGSGAESGPITAKLADVRF